MPRIPEPAPELMTEFEFDAGGRHYKVNGYVTEISYDGGFYGSSRDVTLKLCGAEVETTTIPAKRKELKTVTREWQPDETMIHTHGGQYTYLGRAYNTTGTPDGHVIRSKDSEWLFVVPDAHLGNYVPELPVKGERWKRRGSGVMDATVHIVEVAGDWVLWAYHEGSKSPNVKHVDAFRREYRKV